MKIIKIVIAFLLITLVSRSKKEVKIPIIALDGEEEVTNNSQIWMFSKEKNGKKLIKVNEKNRISTTHWLFNIDKGLPIKEVLPEAVRLRIKHNEKSPHNTGGMNNYFSYVNSLNNKWSFYHFDSIQYKFVKEQVLQNHRKESDTILIKISNTDFGLRTISKTDSLQIIQPAFEDNLSFQNYMQSKAELEKLISLKQISRVEYIFSK